MNNDKEKKILDNITLILNPFQQVDIKYKLPRLDEGELEVETSVKIKTIKRYLIKKLNLKEEIENIEIFYKCNHILEDSQTISCVMKKYNTISNSMYFYYKRKC